MIIIRTELSAFILDLDGVITDTAEYHYLSWKRLADDEGIPFDRELNEKMRGVSRRKSLEILLQGRDIPEEVMQEMMSRKNGYYQEFIQQITEDDLLPGARQLLDELLDIGFKLAVASASKNARKVIDRLGIADLFAVIADGYSVERAKPAPDLFLYAARKLPAAPEECAVIEDAAAGVEAARAAGMLSIGIGPAERVGQAAFFYPSVADIDLSDILGEKVD